MKFLTEFHSSTIEKIGFYVYVYVDPRNEEIFYVGKGIGNRCFFHLADKSEKKKVARIQEILKSGFSPKIEIVAHELETEEMAHIVERAIIDTIGLSKLTNVIRGHGSAYFQRSSVDDLNLKYHCPRAEISEPAIIVRINRLYKPGISDEELYEATRGVWVIGSDREKARFALAVYKGIVREVYAIKRWMQDGTLKYRTRTIDKKDYTNRWEFEGRLADEMFREKWRNRTVEHLLGKNVQSPIVYVNIKGARNQ